MRPIIIQTITIPNTEDRVDKKRVDDDDSAIIFKRSFKL